MSANHYEEWKPVRIYGHGVQPYTGKHWNCLPAWDVTAVYDEPDGTIPHPHNALSKNNPEGDYPKKDDFKNVFWNRHIDRRFHIEYPLSKKDKPRVQSWTIGDPDKEWDILIEHRDRFLSEAGLTLESDPESIARCLAEQWAHETFRERPHSDFEKSNRQLNNPIEGLLHQSHCVGAAVAFAALAESCGLPVRNIGCGGHWIAEVKIGDQWHCVDSVGRHEKSRGFPRFWKSDYLDITLDPMGDHADELNDENRGGPFRRPNPQFHLTGGTWQSPMTLRFATSNAFALYPDRKNWGFSAYKGTRLPIIARAAGFYWPTAHGPTDRPIMEKVRRSSYPLPMSEDGFFTDYLYHPLTPGEKLRQSIWLDATDDMKEMEIVIPFAASMESDFSEATGRQLILKIGDFSSSLSDLGAWPPKEKMRKVGDKAIPETNLISKVTLPADVFKPNAVNWIELHHNRNTTLYAPMLPAVMEPYIPPLWSETEDAFRPPRVWQ